MIKACPSNREVTSCSSQNRRNIIIMSGKKKKSQSKSATAAASSSTSHKTEDGSARIGAAKDNSSVSAATNSSGSRNDFIRDLPPPSQTVQHRGAAAALVTATTSGGAFSGATTHSGGGEVARNNPPHFSHLEQPIPITHSCSLPSLPSTSLRPRMTSIFSGGEYNDPSNTSHVDRNLSKDNLQQMPSAPVPLLSRTLSTPESSSNPRSAFGRAGSAFGRFSTASASRPNTTYTQSDPGFSAFHPVTWNCQRSLSSAGSGSLVGSEIIEEHDVDSGGVKATARTSSAPSNNMTRGFLLKAREKLQTTKLQTTKRRSGRENPARPSLSDAEDVSSRPTTIITNNDDGVEISISAEDKTVPPKIERVSPPSKMGVLGKPKKVVTKLNTVENEVHHEDPGLELNFTDSDDDGSIDDEVIHQPSVEVALATESRRPPSRAGKKSQVPFDEKAQTYAHSTIAPKISAVGAVATKFKFKSPARGSKAVIPSSYTSSSSPHQSPNAGTTSSSSNGSPDSRGGLSTISSNSNSISSAANMRSKINSAASSPGGGDSCAKESMGSSTTNSEIRDFVRESQVKNVRPPRPAGKEGNVDDYETVSIDMDGNGTIHSNSVGSCSSPCLREGAINPHIEGLTLSPGGPSVSLNRSSVPDEAPFDEQSRGSPEVGGNTNAAAVKKEDNISKFIAFASKKVVRSESPHSADNRTTSSSASNASVSNATSSSSGGGSQQPVMFVAYERVEEREESPFDEHHHEENRIATPQNVIRPTITNASTSLAGQRPPVSPRKVMSGRVSTPSPTPQSTLLSGAITPASPPTIADRLVLVRDLAGAASGSRSAIPKPKSNRMKMILVPPKKHTTPPVVSPERHHHSQSSSVNVENNLQQQVNSAIISPEKAN